MYKYLLLLHILGATIWTGGHLVLAVTVLPRAVRSRSPEILLQFESGFEKLGIPALIIQVITGVWLAYLRIPSVTSWFALDNLASRLITGKLVLLLLTIMLAAHARIRIIPRLSNTNLNFLAYHIIAVTFISLLFVVLGVSFRTGGFF
ncbi:MAG: copper resistance protein CopD [Gammaproteobacteria bacterium]|nr:copper resistance protein CopD [Gammaproteobacteria bacterium]